MYQRWAFVEVSLGKDLISFIGLSPVIVENDAVAKYNISKF